MNITIVNQQGHNFGDEAAGAGLLNRILQYEEVENVTVLYASDSILPITDSRIIYEIIVENDAANNPICFINNKLIKILNIAEIVVEMPTILFFLFESNIFPKYCEKQRNMVPDKRDGIYFILAI